MENIKKYIIRFVFLKEDGRSGSGRDEKEDLALGNKNWNKIEMVWLLGRHSTTYLPLIPEGIKWSHHCVQHVVTASKTEIK